MPSSRFAPLPRRGLLLALLAAPLVAQVPPPAAPAPLPVAAPTAPAPLTPPAAGTVRVVLTTGEGPVTLDIEQARAPVTAGNFLRYVDGKRLDGTSFYRAVKVQANYGIVQGGPNNAPKRVLPPIKHEPTTETGLRHTDGTISMARNAPGSAQGEFFITIGDQASMDADPTKPGDNLGFAAFGHVVAGMEVVRHILDAPTSPTAGPPGMQGQMLAPAIRILTARRAPSAAPPPSIGPNG